MVAMAKTCALAQKIDKLLPTEREAKALAFILQHQQERGFTPSLLQIAVRCGVTKGTVQTDLSSLRDKGCVELTPRAGRSVVVTGGVLFLGDVQ